MNLSGKKILVTGGTGSFGHEFVRTALKEYSPKAIRIFSRDELKQQQMQEKFRKSKNLTFLIGDVRDRNRLFRAMTDVDLVIHAAALKQVPSCEYNPIEAVRTNIEGAVNIIDAAIDARVKRIMALSTDKAVYPVNLYGATKLVAEKLFIQANSYTGNNGTIFSCVRYGNVIGSRGSIVPLFRKQAKTGILNITDKRMTRFWITQQQAVKFIVCCIERMRGGEIFVPRIPSMKIVDLAEAIAPNAQQKIIGIRSGEKINETLLTQEEAKHSRMFADYFVIEPQYSFWHRNPLTQGGQFPATFEYASHTNDCWLTKNQLKEMLKNS